MSYESRERSPLSETEETAFAELAAALDYENTVLNEIRSILKTSGGEHQGEAVMLDYRSRIEIAQNRTRTALADWFKVLRKE